MSILWAELAASHDNESPHTPQSFTDFNAGRHVSVLTMHHIRFALTRPSLGSSVPAFHCQGALEAVLHPLISKGPSLLFRQGHGLKHDLQ